jgi:hypothetical protein
MLCWHSLSAQQQQHCLGFHPVRLWVLLLWHTSAFGGDTRSRRAGLQNNGIDRIRARSHLRMVVCVCVSVGWGFSKLWVASPKDARHGAGSWAAATSCL